MSAFSDKQFDAKQYGDFRPQYPSSLFDIILKYHGSVPGNKFGTLLDIGCGTGQAFKPLSPHFQKVVATDLSTVMVERSKEVARTLSTPVEFYVCPAEKVPVEDASVDVVVAGECVHWFDTDKWFNELSRLLRDNGTVAYFAYVDPVFVGAPEANQIYDEMVYEDGAFLGPYWEQPGRGILRRLYKDVNEKLAADSRFSNVEVVYHDPAKEPAENAKFTISRNLTVAEYLNYAKTWSSYHRWQMANQKKPDAQDPLQEVYRRLNTRLGWDLQTSIQISWKTVYVLARKVGHK